MLHQTLEFKLDILLAMLEIEYRGTRLKRVAYVCSGGQVQHVDDLGYSTLTSAFVNRPKDCQYCVMQSAGGGILLIDMHDLFTVHPPGTEVHYKEESTQGFPTVEAAIMYALAIE